MIPIKRALTTTSTAIFVPFTTQELFMGGESLYYGLNALSNNMIMVDRKIDTLLCAGKTVIFPNFDHSTALGRLLSDFMKGPDACRICAGKIVPEQSMKFTFCPHRSRTVSTICCASALVM